MPLFLIETFISLSLDRRIFLIALCAIIALISGGIITGMIYSDEANKHKMAWFLSGSLIGFFILVCILFDISKI